MYLECSVCINKALCPDCVDQKGTCKDDPKHKWSIGYMIQPGVYINIIFYFLLI